MDTAPHGWTRAFRSVEKEHGLSSLRVEGAIPDELRGVVYRTGPGIFETFGRRYVHWFDCDGAVSGVRFEGKEGARGGVRVVQSEGLREEQARGKALYNTYMTPAPSWFRRVGGRFTKNAANTSVTLWQGRLFGLFEGGLPTEIDTESLATLGESTLEGMLVRNFSAHPHRVPKRKTLYNFALRYERHCWIDLFALPDEGKASKIGSVRTSQTVMIHDWIATEDHFVFLVSPVLFHTFKYLLGMGAYANNLSWRPDLGTEILVIPIDDPEKAVRFDAEPFFVWHFANGYEDRGELVVDFVRYEDFKSQETLTQFMKGPAAQPYTGRLSRVRIDPKQKTLKSERLAEAICEFPTVSPRVWCRPHRYTYLAVNGSEQAAHGLHDTVLEVDGETGRTEAFDLGGAGRYASEALFAPRPGGEEENDGWVIVPVYDSRADATHYAVFDARRPGEPALARCHFDHHIPFTFHGTWSGGGRFAGV